MDKEINWIQCREFLCNTFLCRKLYRIPALKTKYKIRDNNVSKNILKIIFTVKNNVSISTYVQYTNIKIRSILTT